MTHRRTLAAAMATMLTSISLYSVFSGQAWFWAGAGAIAVVACTGTLTRMRPLPAAAGLAASTCVLLAYLNVVFAAARSWLLIVPTPSSLGFLWHLAGQGITDAARQTAPVSATPGLLLLATAGIGAVAAVTDLLAARLRGSAAAGLPLLALFGAPATTSASRGAFGTAVVFCLGAAGYLVMLSADGSERIRQWGRSVASWRGGVPGTGSLAPAGRRTGLAAILIALCTTLAVPGLHTNHVFAFSVGTGTGGPGLFPRPLAGMNADLHESLPQVVLTYRTADPEPQYLQMYVLSDLTATSWTMDPHMKAVRLAATPAGLALPPPPGLSAAVGGGTVTTDISVAAAAAGRPGGLSVLPLPYPATLIQVPGRWSAYPATLMVFSTDAPLSDLHYAVKSREPAPSAQQLSSAPRPPAAISRQYLSVPASFRSLASLARRVTSGAATAYGKALALQEWFTQSGQFSYSLNAPEPDSAAALRRFLTVTRRGYCQQFAFAMAVLARLLGIPARVAVGFTAGTPEGNGTWVVRTSDAHAWPELYFQGAGWLRFEPTPSGPGGQGTAYPPAYSIPQSGPTGPAGTGSAVTGGQQRAEAPRAGGGTAHAPRIPAAEGGGSAPGHAVPGGGSPAGPAAIALLALGVVASAPRAYRSLRRRHRWRLADSPLPAAAAAGRDGAAARAGTAEARRDARRAHAAWHEFLDDLTDYGMSRMPSESPRTTARRISERLALPPPAAGALERIALAEERASYSGRPGPSQTLPGDVAHVRRGLSASAGRWRRWQARVFPASALSPVRAAARRAAAALTRSAPGQTAARRPAAGVRD